MTVLEPAPVVPTTPPAVSAPTPAMPVVRTLDLVAVVALAGLALLGWWSTFDGRLWLFVGLAGAVVGVGVVLHSARRGPLWLAVTLPLAYVGTVIPITGLAFGDAGLPAPATVTQVFAGTFRCWGLLVGTHPPIEGSGVVLLAPYLAAFVASVIATLLAVHTRSPIWPVLPLLGLLAGVLVTGNHTSVSVLLLGGAFALGALCWSIERAGRLDPSGPTAQARWALALPLVALSAAVAVPLGGLALGDGSDRLVLREETAAFPAATLVTPLDTFRRFRRQPGDQPNNAWDERLMTITREPAGAMLRIAVLDTYDGVHWVADNDTEPARADDRFMLLSAANLSSRAGSDKNMVHIALAKAWNSQWLPFVGRLDRLNTYLPGTLELDDIRYNPVTSTAVATRVLGAGDTYEFFAEIDKINLPREARPATILDQGNYAFGAFLDPWVQAVSRPSGTRLDAVLRAADLMKQRGRYSDGAFGWEVQFRAGQDTERLGEFMNSQRMVGNDEQYAAAMALLATRIGVPARVVVGAGIPADGEVRGRDVVAWVELRVRDGSWRILPPETYMSTRRPTPHDPPIPPVFIPQPEPQPTPDPTTPSPTPDPEPDQDPTDQQTESSDGSRSWLLWMLLPVAAGVIPGLKLLRRARRRRAARVSLRYAGAWQELVDRARDLGLAVPSHRSRPAQAVTIDDTDAPGLARAADDAIFAAGDPRPEQAEAYWTSMLDVRGRLGARVSWRRRLLAPFSLASLRRT